MCSLPVQFVCPIMKIHYRNLLKKFYPLDLFLVFESNTIRRAMSWWHCVMASCERCQAWQFKYHANKRNWMLTVNFIMQRCNWATMQNNKPRICTSVQANLSKILLDPSRHKWAFFSAMAFRRPPSLPWLNRARLRYRVVQWHGATIIDTPRV